MSDGVYMSSYSSSGIAILRYEVSIYQAILIAFLSVDDKCSLPWGSWNLSPLLFCSQENLIFFVGGWGSQLCRLFSTQAILRDSTDDEGHWDSLVHRKRSFRQVGTSPEQQFSFCLGACPIIGRMVSIVIPASFKPESRPAPKKDFRIMDSGLKTAGMTAS